MNIKMKIKYLLTISLAVLLSACTQPNNDVPIQSNGEYIDNNNHYQNPSITTTDALAVGAVGVPVSVAEPLNDVAVTVDEKVDDPLNTTF